VDDLPDGPGRAGEVRLTTAPTTADDAVRRVRIAVAWAAGRPVTGFTLTDLVALTGGDAGRLSGLAARLRAEGLCSLAAVALDRVASDETVIEQVRAVLAGGLGAWRTTVDRANDAHERLALIERACALQGATGAIRMFAPLPRVDPSDTPSTGYDDVRTIAAARVRCRDIVRIQVDWSLYGPKLAQVAIAFGANDIDGVSPVDVTDLGPRRSPLEEIRRQIQAAGGEPLERDAAYLGA
jgi:hypothetical protein